MYLHVPMSLRPCLFISCIFMWFYAGVSYVMYLTPYAFMSFLSHVFMSCIFISNIFTSCISMSYIFTSDFSTSYVFMSSCLMFFMAYVFVSWRSFILRCGERNDRKTIKGLPLCTKLITYIKREGWSQVLIRCLTSLCPCLYYRKKNGNWKT